MLLDGIGGNLRRVAADLNAIQDKLDARREHVEKTIFLPIHWGSARSYVRAIEKLARQSRVSCRTVVTPTGLLSKEAAFTLSGEAVRVHSS